VRSIEIALSTRPEVKAVLKAGFPSYNKRKCYVSVWPGSQRINSYWDGGSRDEYAIVELATLRRHPLPTSTHPYFDLAGKGIHSVEDQHVIVDHVGNVTLKHLPEGFVLISAGTFCGKPATAHIWVPAANMPRLLPETL
jgi:hypothetical protein